MNDKQDLRIAMSSGAPVRLVGL